jgi:hypothetical protein
MQTLPTSPLRSALVLLCAALAGPALAATDIDVVYGDDIARRGELAAELAARWSQSSRSGELGGRTVWQGLGELAYGLSDNWNVGVKLPVARIDGAWRAHDAYLETKYVAPHGAEGFYWGAEVEAGSVKPAGEERTLSIEAFPILGYRIKRLHLIANPGLEYSSEGEDKGWSFAPKAKIAYSLDALHAVGLEYHVDAGKLNDLAPRGKRQETAYLTWDAKLGGKQFSLALGHGTTHRADRWALRVGLELDD